MARKGGSKIEAIGGVQPDKVPERAIDGKPTIYTYATCPFSLKVKSLLKSRGIEFSNVEVDPMKKPNYNGLTEKRYPFS